VADARLLARPFRKDQRDLRSPSPTVSLALLRGRRPIA
jgi:hypothetical protein